MDPLPVLKKDDEEEEEKDWTLRENDDGHEIDDEFAVRTLWTLGGGMDPAWSDTGAAILDSFSEDTPKAAAESIMNFLGHVAHRDDASETEKQA